MMFDLTGKRALVTGSTRGLGRAIAEELGRAGARVVISSNETELCPLVAAELAAQDIETLAIACDVSVDAELAGMVEQIDRAWGGLDILICNAGVNLHNGPSPSATDEVYDKIMRINLRSTYKLCNLVIPGMAARHEGAVVLMSSLSGLRGNRSFGVYSLTKAAVAAMARNLAVEWGPDNVRVNAISPGFIDTELANQIKNDPPRYERRLLQTPLRRIGTPREVAGSVLYLVSEAGAFTTGINLVVDGGTLITD